MPMSEESRTLLVGVRTDLWMSILVSAYIGSSVRGVVYVEEQSSDW